LAVSSSCVELLSCGCY